jgi:hypothetical protein
MSKTNPTTTNPPSRIEGIWYWFLETRNGYPSGYWPTQLEALGWLARHPTLFRVSRGAVQAFATGEQIAKLEQWRRGVLPEYRKQCANGADA